MSRSVVILLGIVLWASFAVVTAIHIASGAWMVPLVAMVLVGTGVAAYHARPKGLATSRVEIEVRD